MRSVLLKLCVQESLAKRIRPNQLQFATWICLSGSPFFEAHHEEIAQLLRNEAERAAGDNPLARIMEWKRDDSHNLTVTTTNEHLAQRLGNALEKAYGGNTHYDFSHENKLARVNWRRK